MRARRTYIIVGLLVVVATALALPAVQVCRDWAFVDRNTGSRKGYRDWFFGWRTNSWYQESAIEAFIRSNYPGEFRQDWVSYAGTGRNIFGGATLHGHGRPGPIVLLEPEVIGVYCRSASDIEKRRLYDVFASGDGAKIRELADQISETIMTAKPDKNRDGSESEPADSRRHKSNVSDGWLRSLTFASGGSGRSFP